MSDLRLLAFDTSTETLSLAVVVPGRAPLAVTSPGGAQASATLLPAIRSLLGQAEIALAQLDAIVFGRGPGSFTGLRTACSVAQGLGFGSGVPLLPVDTLLAIAEQARAMAGVTQAVTVLDARMDEVYLASYAFDGSMWRCEQAPVLARPEDVRVPAGWRLAGNAVAAYGERLDGHALSVPAWPTAEALLRVAPALLADGQAVDAADALPLYIRDKVAQTTEERAALRALKSTPA